MIPVLLSWSGGKDAAWALHTLRQRGDVDVVGLLTTLTEGYAAFRCRAFAAMSCMHKRAPPACP